MPGKQEIYTSLYNKYASDLTSYQIQNKVNYALKLDEDRFISSFYKKYTGTVAPQEEVNYIKSAIATNEEAKKAEKESEIKHVSQKDYLDISKKGFGWFGDGREEIMQDKLYKIYNPTYDVNKVQFEQFGSGNNIKVTLANGDTDTFALSGEGDMEEATMKEDHLRLTEFIGQKQRKILNVDTKLKFEEILLDRDEAQLMRLDNNIADDLNAMGLKGRDADGNVGDYKFEAVSNLLVNGTINAVKITTPTGAKKTVNVGGLGLGYNDIEEKKKIMNYMVNFIESDPKSWSQTKVYQDELEAIEQIIDPFLEEKNLRIAIGSDLLNPASKKVLINNIKEQLGTLEGSTLLDIGSAEKTRKFRDISIEDQDNFINQKIEEYVNGKVEKVKSEYAVKEYKDLIDSGLDENTINKNIFGEEGRIYSRFTNDYDRKIYLNIKKLEETTDEDKKEELTNNIKSLKMLKEEALGIKASFFLDMKTLEYKYSSNEDVGQMVYDVTDEKVVLDDGTTIESINGQISALEAKMADGKLTREELKEEARIINLAVDEWQDKHDNSPNAIYLSSRDATKAGNVMYKTDAWIMANKDKWTEFAYTNPDAAEAVSNYLSRIQLGTDLKSRLAVYDHVYGLNETVLSKQTQAGTTFVEGLVKSVSTYEQQVQRENRIGLIGEESRRTFNEVLESDLGYEPTTEEKEHAKASTWETVAGGTSALPKIILDFWIGNKALGAVGLNRIVGATTANLNKARTSIKLADGTTKNMTRSQLIKHIKTVQSQKKGAKYSFNTAKTVDKEQKIIDKWMKMKQPNATSVKAHPLNRAAAIMTNSLYEGVKMEVAMQVPKFTGMGYDPETASDLGSSFATGFGFGFMGGIIPWNRMYKATMGTKAGITTKAKPGLFGMEAAYKGVKVPFTNKEVAFKGMYDYLVAAPVNFYAGSQFGGFTSQIADHMMNDADWDEWINENYGDWDHVYKHALTELISGVAMRAHKFNKLDFTTEGKLIQLRQKAHQEVYGDKKTGKKGIMEQKSVKGDDGKVLKEYELDPNTGQPKVELNPDSPNYGKPVKTTRKYWDLRKGKTELDLEPFRMVIEQSSARLREMQDTKQYLDPITGPLKLIRDFKPMLEKMGVEKNTIFTYDYSKGDGFNMKFIEPGKRFYNPEKDAGKDYREWTGRLNKSKQIAFQGVFNPRSLNPGHVPHELLHVATNKLFGEDVMFKGKYIDALVELAKEMKNEEGDSLYKAMVDAKVLKEGSDFDYKQVKEHELFSYIGEYFKQEGNQQMLEGKYGFDKLASLTYKQLSEKFEIEPDRLNTRKELVYFYSNYAKSIGEGRGFKGTFKHLEKFVSPTKTKRQQARREASDKKTGRGFTFEMKSTNLNKRINELVDKRKAHPAFTQFKEDKDVKKYKNNPEIKKINSEIKKITEAIENMPEDIVFGKQSPVERTVNDFARIDGRMMTNAEWKSKGLWDAYKELESVGGKFDNLLTKGMNFEKGATLNGYNMGEWLQRVKWGIEGKTSTAKKPTYIDKGIIGTLERYKPETDLEGKESLSAWINKQYAKRQTAVKKWMINNPKAVSIESKSGEGRTLGDRLLAPEDVRVKTFEEQDLSYGKTKQDALEWIDIVQIEGKRLKNELTIETKEFEKKGGWKETILNNAPKVENIKNVSPKDIMDIGIEFTHGMMGVKLTESQKTKPNDLGKDNLINFQKWVDMEWKAPVTEATVSKTGEIKEKQPAVDDTGGGVFKTIKNVETITTVLNRDATIKFDKGVSEKIKGTSSFKKLGTLAKLFHKATVKDYTIKEMKDMGYEVNPTPNADGSWRVATGPGNAIWMPGKTKGKPITSSDIKEFLGKKKDGSWTELSADRSLAGKSRRIMEIINGSLVEQTFRDADVLDANIAWNLKSSKSQGLWSKTLGREKSFYNKEKFLEQVKTSTFYEEFYREIDSEARKGDKGSAEKGVINALVNHFAKYSAKDSKFDMDGKTLNQIGKEIYKEFKFSKKISPDVISMKAEKAVVLSSDLSSVEAKYADAKVYSGPGEFFDYKKGDLSNGYTREFEFAKRVDAKHGVGYYESHYLSGAAEGGGIGKYASMKNMFDNVIGTLRYSLLRGANKGFAEGKGKAAEEGMVEYDGYAMLDAVHKAIAREKGVSVSSLRKYTKQSKDKSREVGIKKAVMESVELTKGSKKINIDAVKKLYKQGETNKKALKEAVEDLMVNYRDGNVSQRIVRQWVEMHAGNMFGLIKTSASLAVIPKGQMKDLIKEFGTNPENWVLEHITPAKYVKARIYDYILSKGDPAMKEAMDLTIRDHHTTLIPKKYDTAVNKTLQEDLPSAHLPGMDPLQARYYDASHPIDFNLGLKNVITGKVYNYHPNLSNAELQKQGKEVGENIKKLFPQRFRKLTAKNLNSKNLNHLKNIDDAFAEGRKTNKKKRGMSTFDFDETVGVSENYVVATKGKETKRIASDRWPFEGEKLVNEGWKMDFSDFNKVTDGKPGPLMQKMKNQIEKFGPENVFILTARAPESQGAIHEYLKSEGINIPKENITGLGNSTGEAKALWMLEKFAEGYNDMYFVDDALPNVKAVKEALDQLDVKSNVQVARQLNSKNLNNDFNKILEEVKGIGAEKTYSEAKGQLAGKRKGKYKFFGTPGAEDFAGLVTYSFAGKGKKGEAHKKFFEDNLQKPFNRAYNDIHSRKQNISNDYKALRKEFSEVRKKLNQEVDGVYTVEQAVRVYLWEKAGMEIPGLSKADKKTLTDHVKKDSELTAFAENLSKITMLPEGYLKPSKYWLGENLTMDMNNVVDRVYRKEALAEFVENREAVFGKWEGGKIVGKNMNKIEAAYGPKHREALENILWRMENGTNRKTGADSNTNKWMNWVNSATGTIMFFNQKSAALQTISSLNYVNGSFNNPLRAAQAFANQKQYWKDFVKIFGSDMMVQRRSGLKINIEANELIERVGSGEGGFAKFRAYLLEKGFIPTKYADSFAIASGGATFYRNSIRKHIKNGMSKVEGEKRAWEDFTEMTEATQQSSRPDLISMQQASALGRPILAFANTPMQMFRRHKRRIQDIANGRGNILENTGSALYYGFAQTLLFSFLANAMFAVDDESDDPEDIKFAEKKKSRHVNTIADSYLRGMGTGGAGVSALKNGIMSFMKESKKDHNADYGNTVIDMLNVSPPIGSKARKLYSAGKSYMYNKEAVHEMGLDFDNPATMALANVVSAFTNLPADRAVMKIQNIRDASMGDFENWQRVSMLMGINKWQLGVGEKGPGEIRVKEVETRVKEEKKTNKQTIKKQEKEQAHKEVEKGFIEDQKKERRRGKKEVTCAGVKSSGERCGIKTVGRGKYCTIHQKVDQRSDGKKKQCRKRKSDNTRCKVQTSSKSGYCYYHD